VSGDGRHTNTCSHRRQLRALRRLHRDAPAPTRGPVAPLPGCRSRLRPRAAARSQRNVLRALRRAQSNARTSEGKPTFPALFEPEPDAGGRWVPCEGRVPAGTVPSVHGFRHGYASYAIAAGDSAEEVSWTATRTRS
jgi:hypothetical protein